MGGPVVKMDMTNDIVTLSLASVFSENEETIQKFSSCINLMTKTKCCFDLENYNSLKYINITGTSRNVDLAKATLQGMVQLTFAFGKKIDHVNRPILKRIRGFMRKVNIAFCVESKCELSGNNEYLQFAIAGHVRSINQVIYATGLIADFVYGGEVHLSLIINVTTSFRNFIENKREFLSQVMTDTITKIYFTREEIQFNEAMVNELIITGTNPNSMYRAHQELIKCLPMSFLFTLPPHINPSSEEISIVANELHVVIKNFRLYNVFYCNVWTDEGSIGKVYDVQRILLTPIDELLSGWIDD